MQNTNKHTPGPWETETKGSRHFIDGADGLTVALLDRGHPQGVRTATEAEANARLIASSPDLLAALDAIEKNLTALLFERVLDSTLPEFYTVRDARNDARAAIARATGQA